MTTTKVHDKFLLFRIYLYEILLHRDISWKEFHQR
jgi:hypothetical protein